MWHVFSYPSMNWFKFLLSSLVIVCVNSSIPHSELPENPTFEQAFKNVAEILRTKNSLQIEHCPYHMARLLLTLDKYFVPKVPEKEPESQMWSTIKYCIGFEVQTSSIGMDEPEPEQYYKYKLVVDKMREAYSTMGTDSKFNHISGFEFMINYAITVIIRDNSHDGSSVPMIARLLDEALVSEHPLNVFSAMESFAEDVNWEDYDFEDIQYGPYFSIGEEYEAAVRKALLRVLNRIKPIENVNEKLSKAGKIDLLVLISQHFSCMSFYKTDYQFAFLKILEIVNMFTDLAFNAFVYYARHTGCLGSSGYFLIDLREYIHRFEPYEWAIFLFKLYRMDLKNEVFTEFQNDSFMTYNNYYPPLLSRFYQILINPGTLDELRVHYSTVSGLGVKKFKEESLLPMEYHNLFVYDVYKKSEEIFPGIVNRLTGESPTSLLNSIETEIQGNTIITAGQTGELPSIYSDSLKLGWHRVLKFLPLPGLMISELDGENKLVLAKTKMVKDDIELEALDKALVYSFDPSYIKMLFDFAILNCKPEVFKNIFEHILRSVPNPIPRSKFEVTAFELICQRKFLNFDLIYEKQANASLSPKTRMELFSSALDSRLPDEKIREYISKFGEGCIKIDGMYTSNLFNMLAANGYDTLIKEFDLCRTLPESRAKALGMVSIYGHDNTAELIIGSFGSKMSIVDFAELAKNLIINSDRESLKFLLSTRFGTDIHPAIRAKILLSLIVVYSSQFSESSSESRDYVESLASTFCRMIGWSWSQVEYSYSTRKLVRIFLKRYNINMTWSLEYHDLMQSCLESLPGYPSIRN